MAGSPLKALRALLLPVFVLLGGCDMVLLSPSGDVAVQQRNLIFASTALMLLIIVPVIAATIAFAWRYRASNTSATYTPDWHHSTQLEVLIWTAPLLIIIALGALTWISTHLLDPFRPIGRITQAQRVTPQTKRLTVEVVSLDWKWLFFYPDQGIATVNELAVPVDMPIDFKLTSATVMNTFFVPALAGQIYTMAGMETKLSAVINRPGTYEGFSANYSGAGFSHMAFKFRGLSQADFDTWVAKAKHDGKVLDLPTYQALSRPSEAVPVAYFASFKPDLYNSILNMCAEPGKMCMNEMMAIDQAGGRKLPEGEEHAGEARQQSDAARDRLKHDGARLGEGQEGPGATVPASKRSPGSEDPRPGAPTGDATKEPTQGHDRQGMDAMPGMESKPPQPVAPNQLNAH